MKKLSLIDLLKLYRKAVRHGALITVRAIEAHVNGLARKAGITCHPQVKLISELAYSGLSSPYVYTADCR